MTSLGEKKMNTRFWLENVKETDHLEGLVINAMMILKCILKT